MNERVLLIWRNGEITDFYLESAQDRNFLTIAEVEPLTSMVNEGGSLIPTPIKKRVFEFNHLGPTGIPVYFEILKRRTSR